jgi:hypothetical protein
MYCGYFTSVRSGCQIKMGEAVMRAERPGHGSLFGVGNGILFLIVPWRGGICKPVPRQIQLRNQEQADERIKTDENVFGNLSDKPP